MLLAVPLCLQKSQENINWIAKYGYKQDKTQHTQKSNAYILNHHCGCAPLQGRTGFAGQMQADHTQFL
jgi:hypothetical protein